MWTARAIGAAYLPKPALPGALLPWWIEELPHGALSSSRYIKLY